MTNPSTPDRGHALDKSGNLKDATDMEWPNSPSDEKKQADKNLADEPSPSSSVSNRTRGRAKPQMATKAVSKSNVKNTKTRKPNQQSKNKDIQGDLPESLDGDSSSEEESAEKTFEKLEALSVADRQVTRNKSSQSADIRLIFKAEERLINGSRVKGWLCTVCMENPTENKTWYKGGNSSLRTHISRHENHYTKYIDLCQQNNIQPNDRALPASVETGTPQITLDVFVKRNPIYTPQRLLEHIIKLVVSCDQAFRLVERPEFRELLLFLRPATREDDIPHKTKLREKVMDKAQEAVQNIRTMLKETKGLVSFTFDTWTSRAGDPYIAVTAHFISHPPKEPTEWKLENVIIAFSFISGNHGGDNLARLVTRAIDRFELRPRIGWFTSDNATVNDAVMSSLTQRGMAAERVLDFDVEDRRVRCAAHILNLAAKAFIEGVAPTPVKAIQNKLSGTKRKNSSIYDTDDEDDEEELDDDEEGTEFDVSDLVGKVLALITQIKLSPQARAYFEECCVEKSLQPLQLKKWVRTRWSSMYELLKRLLELQLGVDLFLTRADRSSQVPKLSKGRTYGMYAIMKQEWALLKLITEILQEPAEAQQTFSSETVPTVWRTIHTLEYLQTRWENFEELPKYVTVKPGLTKGLSVLRKYYKLTDKTSVNLICHVLNPMVKMAYIKRKWDTEWIGKAKETLQRIVDRYKQQIQESAEEVVSKQPEEQITEPIKSTGGFGSAWVLATIRQANVATTSSNESELENYLRTPVESSVEDILVWWGRHSNEYPILARIARDYLAIQGSSVASERCFSSSGLTGTDRRNRLNPVTFEGLQILKNAYKKTKLFDHSEINPMEVVHEFKDVDTDPFLTA